MGYSIIQGTTIRFITKKPFKDVAGTAVNPDIVQFAFQVQGGTTTTFTYTNGTGDPSGTIVRAGTGDYYANINTSNYPAGVWFYSWYGFPVVGGADTTKTKVKVEGTVTVTSATV